LNLGPGFDKSCTIGRRQRPNVQALHALGPIVERRFCLPLAATFSYRACVFRTTKLRA
jgi:hypothetical protein